VIHLLLSVHKRIDIQAIERMDQVWAAELHQLLADKGRRPMENHAEEKGDVEEIRV
jgi:hypothetical protein